MHRHRRPPLDEEDVDVRMLVGRNDVDAGREAGALKPKLADGVTVRAALGTGLGAMAPARCGAYVVVTEVVFGRIVVLMTGMVDPGVAMVNARAAEPALRHPVGRT